jgi:hypothetical protein
MSPTTTSPQPDAVSAWASRTVHTVTGPSGQRLRIRFRGLAQILEHGELPTELVDIAFMELTQEFGAAGAIMKSLASGDVTDEQKEEALERMKEYARLQRFLVIDAVQAIEVDGEFVPVTLTEEQLDALPEDDLGMVAELVQRLRAHDARGVRIGVEPLDRWARFRETHGCPDEGCEACETLIRELSSTDVGAL